MSAKCEFKLEIVPDDSPDVSYLEQDCMNEPSPGMQDGGAGRRRLAAYHAGDWHMVGVRAVAVVTVGHYKYSKQYTLKSAGLWGVESDSGAEYFDEIFREECASMADDLREFGRIEVVS